MLKQSNASHKTSVPLSPKTRTTKLFIRLARLLPALLAGLALFVLLQLALLSVAGVYRVQAAPPAGPLAVRTTGVITVQHTVSTTHQMVVFGDGRITNWYLSDNGQNQIHQDGRDSDATTIAILFDQHPRPDVVDVGSDTDFYTTTLITLNDASVIPGYSEDSYVVYASKTLSYQVTQRTLTTDTQYGDWLVMELRIRNTGDMPLTGGKLLYMVDIDAAEEPVHDEGGYNPARRLVYQRDFNVIGYAMGISLLQGTWRGYEVDGKSYPATDIERIDEMTNPSNSISDGNNDVSWIVANIPTLQTDQEAEVSFGLCAKTGTTESDAVINVLDCIDDIPPPPYPFPLPVLEVVKDGPTTARVGDTVIYTYRVSHDEASSGWPVSDITVSDNVAGEARYVRGDTDGDEKLDASEIWTYTASYTIQPDDPDPLVNIVTVDGEAPGRKPVTATDTHRIDVEFNPVLKIHKDGPSTAELDETVVYTFTVSHDEMSDGSPISDITVSDDFAGPVIPVGGDENGNDQLDRDEIWVYTAPHTIQFTDPDPLVNMVTAEGEDRDGDSVAATDSHSIDIEYAPVLDIDKDGPSTANLNEIVVYTFMVSHADTSDGSPVGNLNVSDDIADPVISIGGDENDNNQLDKSETWVYTASYTVPSTSDCNTIVNNIVTVVGQDRDNDAITATDTHSLLVQCGPTGPMVYLPMILKNYKVGICHSYSDDFSDPSSGWPILDNQNVKLYYCAGKYCIRNKVVELRIVQGPVDFSNQYAVEVDAQWNNANVGYEYGLIFGQTNFPIPAYRFVVDPVNQRYRLKYHNGSSWQCVNRPDPCWANSSYINPGSASNHLKAECNGTTITLYVNDQVIWQGDGPNSCSGRVGLETQAFPDPNALAYFDNFQVSCSFGTGLLSSQSGESLSTMSAGLDVDE
jgi:hypothetical protein